MKKTYVKPEIELESFQFSANVAAGCTATTGDYNQCADILSEEDKLWGFFSDSSCSVLTNCYHVPSASAVIANS